MYKAFCISGGGAKIGFGLGVLQVLEEYKIRADLMGGVSAGSLLTAGYCYCGVEAMTNELMKVKRNSDVLNLQNIPAILTATTGIGHCDGFYSMDPAEKILKRMVVGHPKCKGVVGAVNLKTGHMNYFSTDSCTTDQFVESVLRSCSIPVSMETRRDKDGVWVDGGVRDCFPMKRIMDDPMNVVEIHAVVLSPTRPFIEEKEVGKSLLDVGFRTIDVMQSEILLESDVKMTDIYNEALMLSDIACKARDYLQVMNIPIPDFMMNIPEYLNRRYIRVYFYEPYEKVCDGMEFNQANTIRGIKMGQEVARKVLKGYRT